MIFRKIMGIMCVVNMHKNIKILLKKDETNIKMNKNAIAIREYLGYI